MNRLFLLRLSLDSMAAALLLLGLAYWWLGNAVHEVAGTAMFLLLIVHNVFNRRWYGGVTRARRVPRNQFDIGITLALLVVMLILLVTSVLISNALSTFLPPWGGFTVRQIHTLAAYWVLIIVAIHLGRRWPMLMGVARTLLGIRKPNALRTLMLRGIAVAIAVHGAGSFRELGFETKLSMQMTLDWWNFEESVAAFFIHCAAVAGFVIFVIYYGMKLIRLAPPAIDIGLKRPATGTEPAPTGETR